MMDELYMPNVALDFRKRDRIHTYLTTTHSMPLGRWNMCLLFHLVLPDSGEYYFLMPLGAIALFT